MVSNKLFQRVSSSYFQAKYLYLYCIENDRNIIQRDRCIYYAKEISGHSLRFRHQESNWFDFNANITVAIHPRQSYFTETIVAKARGRTRHVSKSESGFTTVKKRYYRCEIIINFSDFLRDKNILIFDFTNYIRRVSYID